MSLKIKLTKIILEAYKKGIYEAEELAAFIAKSGILNNDNDDFLDGYIIGKMF